MLEFWTIVIFPFRMLDVLQKMVKIFSQVKLRKPVIKIPHFLQQTNELIHFSNIFLFVAC